ncbi:PA2778 family cysteine peptidase [Algiphilus sp.]|uniref:PA2778 family cysteine peptidase n=1 Tax=Algiphilus sp. TaxID=1872431 RepID=UPI003C54DD82
MAVRGAAAVVAAALGLTGCLGGAPPLGSVIDRAPVELVGTPFHPQTALQCGPAALATVLEDSGVRGAGPEALSDRLFLPERGGSLQAEMLATARHHGRVPVRLAGNMQAIADALAGGDPVLVLQNLGTPWTPVWHYAVVVALRPDAETVILRSGRERRRHEPAADFMRSWSLAGRWAFVAAPPERIPAFADVRGWLTAAAPAESAGQLDLALAAYEAAVARWPEAALAHAARGNALHARGDVTAARAAWRAALERDPDLKAVRDNLAATADGSPEPTGGM